MLKRLDRAGGGKRKVPLPTGSEANHLRTFKKSGRSERICPLRHRHPAGSCGGSPTLGAAVVPDRSSDIQSALAPLQILSPRESFSKTAHDDVLQGTSKKSVPKNMYPWMIFLDFENHFQYPACKHSSRKEGRDEHYIGWRDGSIG